MKELKAFSRSEKDEDEADEKQSPRGFTDLQIVTLEVISWAIPIWIQLRHLKNTTHR